MTFGEKLQKLRRESGLSQEKLAERLNVSRQAVSKWELGTAAPDVDNIVRLSKFFQVSLEYLMVEDCQEPVPLTDGPKPPDGRPVRESEEKPARKRKWLPLWLAISGVVLEILAYGLCYPMQERSMRMYGECHSDPAAYLHEAPLIWLTLAGGACLIAAVGVWWVRQERVRWDRL